MTPDKPDLSAEADLRMMEVLRLLQHLVTPRRPSGPEDPAAPAGRTAVLSELAADMEAICEALDLKRAVVFEAIYDKYFDGVRLSPLAACVDGRSSTSSEVGAKSRQQGRSQGSEDLSIGTKSEVFSLLHDGQWIPIGQAGGGTTAASTASIPHHLRELSDFLDLRASSKAVLFPLLDAPAGKINGIVLMERDSKAGNFSENLLDLGAIISQMLGPKLLRLVSESGADDSLTIVEEAFDRTVLPVVIINRKTLTIERVNDAASAFLSAGNKLAGASVIGSGLGALFPGASHFIEVLEKACAKNTGPSCFSVSAKDLTHTGCAFALVSFVGEGGKHVWVQLIPENFLPESKGKSTTDGASKRGGSRPSVDDWEDDAVLELSRRLNFERWLRQTICKLHSSLDRDHVLQTLADSLGRAFRATRCLVIRTDGPSHPMVTHEYVEPDLSPLGLGRTGQFPMFAISLFVPKTVSFGDVSQMKSTGPLIPPEVDQLLENGILSMAGAPLSYQGQPFGVLILVDGSRPRRWTEEELETIELTASQASVALSHSQTYHQAKDQLFHMNLLGNLTQQLTNALEVATKSPSKSSSPTPERTQSEGSQTPLSSREMEVLRLIASGFANREIAQRLFLTESTVELHASRIRKKLQLKSRTALVKYACDNSLV